MSANCPADHVIFRIEIEPLTLQLDLVLDDESLALVVNCLWEFGGNSVMSSGVLDDETLVTLHSLEDLWFLNGPLADVLPLLLDISSLHVLLDRKSVV